MAEPGQPLELGTAPKSYTLSVEGGQVGSSRGPPHVRVSPGLKGLTQIIAYFVTVVK